MKTRQFWYPLPQRLIAQHPAERRGTEKMMVLHRDTGVTHQIRAQLALAGLHIVNDRLYGAFAVENQTGHCLHALAAEFRHPLTGETTTIQTPLPAWAK